jgi:hypothetical protein
MQAYSNPEREDVATALPDIEVFELTAREVAEMDDDMIYEYMKRHEFRLAAVSNHDRDCMFDKMIREEGITGGWYYWYCLPGCLPDSDPIGPFESWEEAKRAAQENAAD